MIRMFVPIEGLEAAEVPVRVDGPDGRFYVLSDGTRLPSVTSVLARVPNPGMEWKRAEMGEEAWARISERATRRGTRLHAAAEKYLTHGATERVELSGVSRFRALVSSGAADPILDWEFEPLRAAIDRHVGRIAGIEKLLWSKRLGAAGTTDLVAEWDGVLSVIDFKTSAEVRYRSDIASYLAQTASYAFMVEEHGRVPIDRTVVAMSVEGERTARVFVSDRGQIDESLAYFRTLL